MSPQHHCFDMEDFMNKKTKQFLRYIAVPLFLGLLSWLLVRNSISIFQHIIKPPFTPPASVFPIVWTILYLMMGIAAYLIKRAHIDQNSRTQALFLYKLQLGINVLWPIFFFRFQWFFFAFIWLLFLWAILWMTVQSFYWIRKIAGILLVPYLLWVTYAGYLNLMISLFNK